MSIKNLQKMTDQSNVDLFSGPLVQLDVQSINALLRVAQAQQQQEYFVPSSQINDYVYTALSNTAEEPEQLFDKELFLEEV